MKGINDEQGSPSASAQLECKPMGCKGELRSVSQTLNSINAAVVGIEVSVGKKGRMETGAAGPCTRHALQVGVDLRMSELITVRFQTVTSVF